MLAANALAASGVSFVVCPLNASSKGLAVEPDDGLRFATATANNISNP
jgi:hypothetical protein